MQAKKSDEKVSKVRLFSAILTVGFIISAYVTHFMGVILHYDYPKNTFLFAPARAGDDLSSLVEILVGGDFYGSQGAMYFPACVAFLFPFTFFNAAASFVIYVAMVSAAAFGFVFSICKKIVLDSASNVVSTSIIVFLSYPVLFCLDRGNLEGLSFIFLIAYVLLFQRRMFWWASVALAIAACTKIYPVIFGVLLLKERRWKPLVLSGVLVVAINFVCASLLPGGMVSSLARMFENQRIANLTLGMSIGGVPYGLSLFSLIKVFYMVCLDGMMPATVFTIYSYICAALTLFCFYFAVRRISKHWEVLFFVYAPWLVFPQVSYAYKLIWLLIPACWMFEDEDLSLIDVWCMGILFIPKTLIPLGIGVDEVTWSVVLDPLMIIILAVRIYLRNRSVGRRSVGAPASVRAPAASVN